MGSTPVILDFSKAQPLTQPGSAQAVTLDFSRAQPISVPFGSYQT